jgi:crotonobetainyl-CoA:carnitine CoA-transferase CaiB-like acyl-CoA transferase
MTPLDKLPKLPYCEGLGFLKGVTVLDLTTSIAGPYSTQLMADLGAEVIKIEKREGGDDARHWGPPFLNKESLWFMSANRNKGSLTLDLTQPEGQGILHDLARQADVIVMNTAARVQAKLGIDYPTLRATNPALIHVSITGFGLEGPGADLPCYDLIAEGYSGIMDLTGEASGPPQKVGTPASDLLAGQDAALAVLAALYGRQRTGVGTHIDISMVASSTRFMASRIVPYLGSGKLPMRSGGTDSVVAIYQVFETADYPITLGLGNDAIWQRFWKAVGQPEYGMHESLDSNVKRCALRKDIVAKIAELLATQPRAAWLELFAQHRIPAGPINTLEQLADDALVQENQQLHCLDGPSGPIPQVGLGIRFDGDSHTARRPPPKLGEDTERILQERLAMSPSDIAGLRKTKVI